MVKKLTIVIDEELHREIKTLAAEYQSTMKNMIAQALREFLRKYSKGKDKE